MKRIVQSRTGEDGTCFRACLASILEVPERRIPDFGAGGDDDRWWADVQAWLGQAGLEYVRTPIGGTKPVGWSTIEGISPRGGLHACVAKDGELVHDPHPQDGTGRGLVEPRYYGVFRKAGGKAKDDNTPDYIRRRELSHSTTSSAMREVDERQLRSLRSQKNFAKKNGMRCLHA